MGREPVRSLTLDAGALIAVEQGRRAVELVIQGARDRALPILVPAAALAQVWRGSPRQARLSQMLAGHGVQVVPLDLLQARLVGVLCGHRKHDDSVDASVAIVAHQSRSLVLTSDPDHIQRLDPNLRVQKV